MNKRAIHITDYDMKRLRSLLKASQNRSPDEERLARELQDKLDAATRIPQREAPPYLVTMNCHVRVTEMDTREEMDFWLSYPDETRLGDNKISVVSETGVAVLGYKVGDQVDTPGGGKQLRIARIHYQPESCQHYRL